MKTKIQTTLIIFAIIVFVIPVFSQDSTKILFLGSSYFNLNSLPDLIQNLADNSNKDVYIDQFIPSGIYLSDHATSPVSEAKINSQDWDFVILQGVGSITAYPDSFTAHPVFPSLQTLQNKIYQNCASTQMFFCLPWAFEDGMTWYGWPDTYTDMQLKAYNNTMEYSSNLDFPIAPVGWAWNTVLEKMNFPLHYLHQSDWNHPSLRGSYLMACVIYSAVFQESTLGIIYNPGLPPADVTCFQEVASNMVLDSLEHWNITPFTGLDESSLPGNFKIHQNFPNPFSNSTQIDCELQKRSFIGISIFDSYGRQICNLYSGFKDAGKHSFTLNGSGLEKGVYYCRFRIDKWFGLRKMLLMR
ncbi:DUF4886 domain-containing protein [Bacteroidota bacterium]